jgi:hypothetical protein
MKPRYSAHAMINQNWWFTTLLVKQHKHCPPLNRSIECDVLILEGSHENADIWETSPP